MGKNEDLEKKISAMLDEKVDAMRRSMIPHTCFTCRWFVLREEKPRNRVCRYPGELKADGRKCLSWALQEDAAKRNVGFY